jgi:hypothetical protein
MTLGFFGAVPLFNKKRAVLTFRQDGVQIATTSVYTFAGQAIGTQSPDRVVHVTITGDGQSNSLVTGVTIGGVSAVINNTVLQNSGTAAIASAVVPTGATADIVVTFAGNKARVVIGVYTSTGLVNAVAFDTKTSIADPATGTLNTKSGGFALGVAGNDVTGTIDWSGGMTKDYETIGGGTMIGSGASGLTSGATITPSADYATAGADRAAVFATFAP